MIQTINTARLTLRRLRKEDAPPIFSYASDSETTRYLTWQKHETIQDSLDFLEFITREIAAGNNDGFGIECKGKGLIGTIGMRRKSPGLGEIGYVIAKPFWGQGYVTEAAGAFVEYLWRKYPELEKIEARCFAGHTGSSRVMEKLGMKYQGYLDDEVFVNLDPAKAFPVWHYTLQRPQKG